LHIGANERLGALKRCKKQESGQKAGHQLGQKSESGPQSKKITQETFWREDGRFQAKAF
jgi:hypothetical protein